MNKCKDKICASDKICNPVTGRCVSRSGKIGKNIRSKSRSINKSKKLRSRSISKSKKSRSRSINKSKKSRSRSISKNRKSRSKSIKCNNVKCSIDKICNPQSGRCVSKTGKIGKILLKNRTRSPVKKLKYPKKKSPVKKLKSPEKKSTSPKLQLKNKCNIILPPKSKGFQAVKIGITYGNDMLLNKLEQCGVDNKIINEFNNRRIDIINNYRELLNAIYKYIQTNPDIINERITRFLAYEKSVGDISAIILSPQLQQDDYILYRQAAYRLKNAIDTNNGDLIISSLLSLITETSKYPENTAILLFLYYIVDDTELKNKIKKFKNEHLNYQVSISNILIDLPQSISGYTEKTIERDNPEFVTIKKDSILFRGVDKEKWIDSDKSKLWYAFDITNSIKYISSQRNVTKTLRNFSEICKFYGIVGAFRVKNDVRLVNMKNVNIVKKLMADMPSKLLEIFKTIFILKQNDSTGELTIIRDSVIQSDKEFVDWLCKKGYNGYICDNIQNTNNLLFQSEVCFCTPKDHIEYIGYYDLKDLVHYCNEVYMKDKIAYSTMLGHQFYKK